MSTTITVDGITKRYGDHTAIDNLSFHVDSGTVFALLGTNGAGKTTTVEILEGYRKPDSGNVRVLGQDPIADSKDLRPRMGLMLQTSGIYPGAKAREIVHLFCSFYAHAKDPDELIELVGLTEASNVMFKRLSGGQQRRLSLAVALAGQPEVLFLDEPTAGMDPMARQTTYGIIRELKANGVTVVLTTHLLDEAEDLAEQVLILDRGRLVACGTPADLMAGSESISFSGPPALELATLPLSFTHTTEIRPGEYLTDTRSTPGALADLTNWAFHKNILLTHIRAGAKSLEEAFLHLVEETNPHTPSALLSLPEEEARAGETRSEVPL